MKRILGRFLKGITFGRISIPVREKSILGTIAALISKKLPFSNILLLKQLHQRI
ncbi:MAG: hypothetical protein ACI9UV_000135 [Algoriphagus sp.]|jgi:hypothetical protein